MLFGFSEHAPNVKVRNLSSRVSFLHHDKFYIHKPGVFHSTQSHEGLTTAHTAPCDLHVPLWLVTDTVNDFRLDIFYTSWLLNIIMSLLLLLLSSFIPYIFYSLCLVSNLFIHLIIYSFATSFDFHKINFIILFFLASFTSFHLFTSLSSIFIIDLLTTDSTMEFAVYLYKIGLYKY